jgi:hypothetical protein
VEPEGDAPPPPLPGSPVAPTPPSLSAPRIPDFEGLELFRDHYKEVFMPPVNWDNFGRHAYAFVDPSAADPEAVLRRALLSGSIPDGDVLCIRPSSLGVGLVVFSRTANRDAAANSKPIPVMEHTVHFERPEELRNRFPLSIRASPPSPLKSTRSSTGTSTMSKWPWG